MSWSSKKTVKTLKELKIQKALGHDVIMCPLCEDKGKYNHREIYENASIQCAGCEMGWKKVIWSDWLKNLDYSGRVWVTLAQKCSEHSEYTGRNMPTVLCEHCWKIWFASPKKPKNLIQNTE